MPTDDLRLGPTQREIYDVLEESDDEMFVGDVAEEIDAISNKATYEGLRKLREKGHVSARESDDERGWFLYSIESEGSA